MSMLGNSIRRGAWGSVIDTATYLVLRVITGLNEPRQAISYSATPGQAYVLNADLSVTIIDYANGQIVANIPE